MNQTQTRNKISANSMNFWVDLISDDWLQSFAISEIDHTEIVLGGDGRGGMASTDKEYAGRKGMRAEVINLSR